MRNSELFIKVLKEVKDYVDRHEDDAYYDVLNGAWQEGNVKFSKELLPMFMYLVKNTKVFKLDLMEGYYFFKIEGYNPVELIETYKNIDKVVIPANFSKLVDKLIK